MSVNKSKYINKNYNIISKIESLIQNYTTNQCFYFQKKKKKWTYFPHSLSLLMANKKTKLSFVFKM